MMHIEESQRGGLAARPIDVEDSSILSLTFSDQGKGVVIASDLATGGMRNQLDIYTGKGMIQGRITPNDTLQTYFVNEEGLDDFYITEKIQTKNGWSPVSLEEFVMRGYVGEMQDFMECTVSGRAPQSGFETAALTLQAIYAGYLSAETGTRVHITQ